MKQKLKWDEIIGILLLAVSVGLLGISVFLSFSRDIWYDELFTMGLASQPFGKLISITARDVHPPLYYLIVKLFLIFSGRAGEGIAAQVMAAKLASVFPFFLCLIYGGTKVRKNFGMLSSGLFAFLLLTMPQMSVYTVEARMYGYALFFITAGMLHAYELVKEEKETVWQRKRVINWILLTLYALAACYTHYFACVSACMIYLYLLAAFFRNHKLKREIRAYLASSVCCVAGFLPWIISVVTFQVGQIRENYWIQPLSFRTLGGCVKFLFFPSFSNESLNGVLAVGLFLIYGALAAEFFIEVIKGGKKEERYKAGAVAGCVGILFGIIAFGFLASFLIRPIFVYRYMLPAMGVFWLAFAILISQQKNKKYFFIPLMILLLVIGLRNYRAFYGEEMWKRAQMKEAGAALTQIKEDEIVVFNFDQVQAVVSFYLNNESYLWYGEPEVLIQEMYPTVHALVEGEFTDEAGIAKIKGLLKEQDQIWFIGSGNARDEIIDKWKSAGIGAEEAASVMIERYWFNLYRICIDDSYKKR